MNPHPFGQPVRGFRAAPPHKPLAAAVALALLALQASPGAIGAPVPTALPTGELVGPATSIQVLRSGVEQPTMVVKQFSDNAIINWTSFSIGSQAGVVFQQPSANSVALNRVTGESPSEIFGSLSSNGKVFLVNTNGVLFGAGASVNVGSLVASTFDLANSDFLAGKYIFSNERGSRSAVSNAGTITAAERGSVALLGASVDNTGTISARLGTVALAAGGKVTLDFAGDGLTRIVVDDAVVASMVSNGGALLADGGQVLMSAKSAAEAASSVVRQTGTLRAQSLVEREGKLVLDGGNNGGMSLGGTLDATGTAAGLKGGAVTVAGREIGVQDARIDVRGDRGGGHVTVTVATDVHSDMPSGMHISAGSLIAADATGDGNGGTVMLDGGDHADFAGSISAKGGPDGGAGGTIGLTVASGGLLGIGDFNADASAAGGVGGVLSIRSDRVIVDSAMAGSVGRALDTGTNVRIFADQGGFSGRSNIELQADVMKSGSAASSLSLNAYNDVVIDAGVTIASTGAALPVYLNANAQNAGAGAIILRSGASILSNGGDIVLFGGSDRLNGYAVGNPAEGLGTVNDGVVLDHATLDSRAGQRDGGAGGTIVIRGKGAVVADGSAAASDGGATTANGITLTDSAIRSGSGDILLTGIGGMQYSRSARPQAGTGIEAALRSPGSGLVSTSGNIVLNGSDGSLAVDGGVLGGYGTHLDMGYGTGIVAGGAVSITGTANGGGMAGSSVPGGDGSSITGMIAAGGSITLTGLGLGEGESGLRLNGVNLATTGGGAVRILGRGTGATGVEMHDVVVSTRATAAGQGDIDIAGESLGGGAGLLFDGVSIGDAATGGAVSIRALNATAVPAASSPAASSLVVNAPMIAVRDSAATAITTRGVIDFRPGGVGADGVATEAPAVPISVGEGGDGFNVALPSFGIGRAGAARVVIGSSVQSGAITYAEPTALNGSLSLQNDGIGSGGITLAAPLRASGVVTLSSGGMVGGDGAISAAGLLLNGTGPASDFELTNPGNAVGTLAARFEPGAGTAGAGGVNVVNEGALAIGALSGDVYSVANRGAARLDVGASSVAGDVVVRTRGALALSQDLSSTQGNIRLVAGTVFNNGADKALTAAGDWQVFADTWAGETRGALAGALPQPNLYNCSYGAACSANLSGNHFVYRQQPVVTLTGASQARTYGDANPVLGYTLAGLVNGDTAGSVLAGGYTTTAGLASNVGTYATTGSFVSPLGYRIDALPGSLTIDPAVLRVAIADAAKVYGGADPLLAASYSGFKGEDTETVVSGLRLQAPTGGAATAGTHAITGEGAAARNYSIVYQPGTLSVSKALLTVRADDRQKQYGGADPALSVSLEGLQYDDTRAVLSGLGLSTVQGAAATAGTHAIVASGAAAQNYSIVYQPGTLNVSKALLTVRADDRQKQYGAADPALSASVEGLQYADTRDVLSGLGLSTVQGTAATAGTHAIVASGATAQNYSVVYQPGTLTVSKALLTVRADDQQKQYGAADPALTASVSGLQYGDTRAVLSGLSLNTVQGAAATAGTHAIVAADASAANYAVQYLPGTLTVAPAVLTYVAAPATQLAGVAAPAAGGSVTGFAYGDTLATASSGTLVFTGAYTVGAAPGVYAVQGGGLAAANYRFVQAAANATALEVLASPMADLPTITKDLTFASSNVYTRNLGSPRVCVATDSLTGGAGGNSADPLAVEWSRVRVSPNLSNCLSMGQRNSCQDF